MLVFQFQTYIKSFDFTPVYIKIKTTSYLCWRADIASRRAAKYSKFNGL